MPRLLPPSEALCVGQCQARCCRAPGSIVLSGREADRMAMRTSTPLVLRVEAEEVLVPRYRLNFSENGGQCPMLGPDARCRIYASRPVCCHHFPTAPDPRCAVWPLSMEASRGFR